MMYTKLIAIAATATLLSACHDGHYHAEASYHYDDHHYDDYYYEEYYYEETYYESSYNDSPVLSTFEIVDTYNTNSEFEPEETLYISPYINSGYFDIYWNIFSDYDYFVEFRFNTEATTVGSRLISSEWCGPGLDCENHQYQYCEYTSDFYLECESGSGSFQMEYIGDMIQEIPQSAYFIVQACDTSFFYCESQIRHVVME